MICCRRTQRVACLAFTYVHALHIYTGALAQQMEEQLMQEFEALLASRRVQGQGAGKAAAAGSSSSGHQGGRRVRGKGVVRLVDWFVD